MWFDVRDVGKAGRRRISRGVGGVGKFGIVTRYAESLFLFLSLRVLGGLGERLTATRNARRKAGARGIIRGSARF